MATQPRVLREASNGNGSQETPENVPEGSQEAPDTTTTQETPEGSTETPEGSQEAPAEPATVTLSAEEQALLAKARAREERRAELKAKREAEAEAREGETKADLFVRMIESRVPVVLEGLRVLGNTFNRANYEYTEEQVEEIFEAISVACQDCLDIAEGKTKGKSKFKLSK